ncbi:hypothetical protein [Nocardia beijingensis]|uniref:hypothetical protein n=1 Tax=Nocardia beijingensis TaxID=95162 RepID=UPI0033A49FE0
MTTRRSWVQDYCEDGNMPADAKHARGLLKIHRNCEPPCPRKMSAERYLRDSGEDNADKDGASEDS